MRTRARERKKCVSIINSSKKFKSQVSTFWVFVWVSVYCESKIFKWGLFVILVCRLFSHFIYYSQDLSCCCFSFKYNTSRFLFDINRVERVVYWIVSCNTGKVKRFVRYIFQINAIWILLLLLSFTHCNFSAQQCILVTFFIEKIKPKYSLTL